MSNNPIKQLDKNEGCNDTQYNATPLNDIPHIPSSVSTVCT